MTFVVFSYYKEPVLEASLLYFLRYKILAYVNPHLHGCLTGCL